MQVVSVRQTEFAGGRAVRRREPGRDRRQARPTDASRFARRVPEARSRQERAAGSRRGSRRRLRRSRAQGEVQAEVLEPAGRRARRRHRREPRGVRRGLCPAGAPGRSDRAASSPRSSTSRSASPAPSSTSPGMKGSKVHRRDQQGSRRADLPNRRLRPRGRPLRRRAGARQRAEGPGLTPGLRAQRPARRRRAVARHPPG